MASSMTAKQMRLLLQSISADPQLKQSQDSILLAEDQYPENLDAMFTKLTTPTTLQNTMTLLQWNRVACDSTYDATLKSSSIVNQDYLRKTYQLTPTADNPWDVNLLAVEIFCNQFMPVGSPGCDEIVRLWEEYEVPLSTRHKG
jgi:hypothetical protein